MRTFERRSESVQAEEKLDDVYDVCLIEQLIPNKEGQSKISTLPDMRRGPHTYRILALADGLALGRAAMTLK